MRQKEKGIVALKTQLSALAYQAGWAVTKKIPQPLADRLFNLLADLVSHRGKGPEQLRKNLSRVVGVENVTRELVRQSMRSYFRYWREAFQLPSLMGEDLATVLNNSFDCPASQQRVFDGVAAGNGLILTLPHAGNWDMAGVWVTSEIGQFATVAERLKPESLFDAFVDYRNSLGFEVLPLTGGKEPPMDRLEEVLHDGGIVCLMGERDLTGRGVVVDFFGEKTSMPAGPAKLAQKTGAALHVAEVFFTEDTGRQGWGFGVSPKIRADRPLEEITQEIAHIFEENISRHPADWHMLQPIFFNDLSPRQRSRIHTDATPQASQNVGSGDDNR